VLNEHDQANIFTPETAQALTNQMGHLPNTPFNSYKESGANYMTAIVSRSEITLYTVIPCKLEEMDCVFHKSQIKGPSVSQQAFSR